MSHVQVLIRGVVTTDRKGGRWLLVGTWRDGLLVNVREYPNPINRAGEPL